MTASILNGPSASGEIATPRPRLLFLCHTLPYPPDGGVWLRTFNVLRLLAMNYEVTALCFERAESAARHGAAAITEARSVLEALVERVEIFPLPQQHSRLRLLWDHFRSVTMGRVFTEYLYDSSPFRSTLRQVMRDRSFDVIHVDSLDLSRYLREIPLQSAVLVHHNVESILLERRAKAELTLWRRWYFALQARLMRRAETEWCPRVWCNVTVSSGDAISLRELAPGARFHVVPNGVDTSYFRPAEDNADDRIVFVGGTTWFPNRDALQFFGDQVLPRIRRQLPDVGVRWVGAIRPGDDERFASFGIDLTGYVDDIRDEVHRAGCVVVPLRVGGGSRLKILDAWAMGKAIVSTTVGAEGLATRPGENILLADTPEAFADEVVRVLRSPEARRSLGAGARATAEATYSWDVVGSDMHALYGQTGQPP